MTTYGASERNQENAQLRRLLFTYEPYQLVVGLFLLVIGVWIGSRLFAADNGYGTNLYTEVLSIGVTVLVLNVLAQRREDRRELQRLKALMASNENVVTQIAVAELKSRGWLYDGSLKEVNLESANLQGAKLTGANLQEANLFVANLQGALLQGANLQGVTLMVANLQEANLFRANLEGAKLGSADLQGTVLWEAILQGIDLSGMNLQDAKLEGAKLHGADLSGANIQGATFMRAELRGADLMDANLQGTNLKSANLTHANMYDVKCDENTILPNGEQWTPNVDWSEFGAVEIEDWNAWKAYLREHGLFD